MIRFFNRLFESPKRIFLIDASGALLSILCLFAIAMFNEFFGMPRGVVLGLIAIAIGLFIFSITCYLFVKAKIKHWLILLILANIAYCCFTIWLVFNHFHLLTFMGSAYFIAEILVIIALVNVEVLILRNVR